MKKTLICCLVFAILFSLTSCDVFLNYVEDMVKTERFRYDYEEISENVDKAEIIKLTAIYHYTTTFTNDYIDESDVEILKTLEHEKTLEFLRDFSQIDYTDGPFVYHGPPSFDEICFRVWYLDGRYELFSGSLTSLKRGNCADIRDYDNLVKKYLEQ